MCVHTGELFKLGMVHEAIIHSCIKEVSTLYVYISGVYQHVHKYMYMYIVKTARSNYPLQSSLYL